MPEAIKFGGEQGSLTIDVYGYERPGAEDLDDANWLKCALTIKVGPFNGAFRSAFTTYDLAVLAENLKKALASLSGTVSFQNTEQDIVLDMAFDKRGTAIIIGTAQPHRSLEASLKFRLDTDQSYLVQTLHEVEAVLHKFPVKAGGPRLSG